MTDGIQEEHQSAAATFLEQDSKRGRMFHHAVLADLEQLMSDIFIRKTVHPIAIQ